MAKILIPASLDQWRSPIASLLRAVVIANPEHQFDSFSNPTSSEDITRGNLFWALPQVQRINPFKAALKRYDLVHTASLNPRNLSIAQYAKLRGYKHTKFLTTLNLEYDDGMGSRDWNCYRRALKLADFFVAVSEAVGKRSSVDFPGRFCGVIPNGFDTDFFDPSLDICYPCFLRENSKPYVLWVSALEPRKNPAFLVALAKLMPDVNFVAAGWEHPFHAHHFLPPFKNTPNIEWVGHVDQIQLRSLLHYAKVMVFPSEREGLPLSVIEAHGMGLPVIAQPLSSLPEIVIDQVNGRLISISDIHNWVIAIRHFMTTDFVCKNIIRDTAVNRFQWSSIGEQYRMLYNSIL
jgi:glycosyltransferase involved in cell wall biosynthesis